MNRLIRTLLGWPLCLLLLLVVLYGLGGRLLIANLDLLRKPFTEWLAGQGTELKIGHLSGRWRGFDPIVEVRELALTLPDGSRLEVGDLSVQFDPFASLWWRQPVSRRVVAESVSLALAAPGEGHPKAEADALKLPRWLPPLLLHQRSVTLSGLRLSRGGRQLVSEGALEWRNRQFAQQFMLTLAGPESGRIRLQGTGKGIPGTALFTARYHAELDLADPDGLLPVTTGLPRLGGEFWGWVDGFEHRVDGRVTLAELPLAGSPLPAGPLTADLLWLQDGPGWRLSLQNLQGRGAELPLAQVLAEGEGSELRRIAVPELDVAAGWALTGALGLLPESLWNRLEALAPSGRLANINLRWMEPDNWQSFRLLADLDGISVAGWHGAPTIAGVEGRLEVTADGGRVDLASDALSLAFSDLYQAGWEFEKARGTVRWRLEDRGVSVDSGTIALDGAGVHARGRFGLWLPQDDADPGRLTLLIGMEESRVDLTTAYVPDRIVSPALYNWLAEALRSGRLRSAGFLFDAPLHAAEAGGPRMQMFFDALDADIAYESGWPRVQDARVMTLIRDGGVTVAVRGGRLYDRTRLEQAEITLPRGERVLGVRARLQGPAEDGRLALLDSPVGAALGEEFSSWQLSGDLTTHLDLSLHLDDPQQSRIRVDTFIKGGRYWSPALQLDVQEIEGAVHYETGRGLWSSPLRANLFGAAASAEVDTPRPGLTRIRARSRISTDALQAWVGLPMLAMVKGSADYSAEIDLCSDRPGCSRVRVESDLIGVAVDAPAPFAKQAEQAAPLSVELELTPGLQPLTISHPALTAALLMSHGKLEGGVLRLGGGAAGSPERGLLRVEGVLDEVDLQAWQRFASQYLRFGDVGGDAPLAVGPLTLATGRLSYGELALTSVRASAHRGEQAWQIALESRELGGAMTLADDPSVPVKLRLERLTLPRPGAGKPDGAEATPLSPPEPPPALPALDLEIAALTLGDRPAGSLSARLRPYANGLQIEQLKGTLFGADLDATGAWLNVDDGVMTRIALNGRGKDFGALMEGLGSARTLDSKRFSLSADLSWQGDPRHIVWPTVQGRLSFDARDGRLRDTESQPVLKLFSLFNVNTLLRRLTLDFSDILRSGTPFDRLQGRAEISAGVARLEKAALAGPQMDLDIDGRMDLAKETLDLDLRVMLPLSANLPIAAALMATPTVAGAVFLIERLIGKELKKFTSVRYRVNGSWSDLVVKPVTQPKSPVARPLGDG